MSRSDLVRGLVRSQLLLCHRVSRWCKTGGHSPHKVIPQASLFVVVLVCHMCTDAVAVAFLWHTSHVLRWVCAGHNLAR